MVVKRLVDIDIRVSRHPENRLGHNDISWKNVFAVFEHQLLQQHEFIDVKRQVYNAVEPGNRDDRQLDKLALCLELRADIRLLIFQKRERMVLIDDLRREHRHDLCAKVLLQKSRLLVIERVNIEMPDTFTRHIRGQPPVCLILACDQRARLCENRFQLLCGTHAAFIIDCIRLDHRRVRQGTDADHEKFIEIAAENRYEFQSFQQRDRCFIGLLKHTLVKFEPAQFPVVI